MSVVFVMGKIVYDVRQQSVIIRHVIAVGKKSTEFATSRGALSRLCFEQADRIEQFLRKNRRFAIMSKSQLSKL